MDAGSLTRFFEQSADLLCIASFDGYFVHLNPAWKNLLGYGLEELQAKPFLQWVHPDDRSATEDQLERLRHGSGVVLFENRYLRRDGGFCTLSWNAQPVIERSLVYAIARDVTEERRRETEARRADRALRRTEAQNEIAREIQRALLPARPTIPGMDIGVAYETADATGGDFYDFIPLPDGSWLFVIADVSTHGFSSALIMADTRRALRTLVEFECDVGQLCRRLNRIVLEDNLSNHFVTAFLLHIDPRTRQFCYVGAGHQGYVVHPDGESTKLSSTTFPLGMFPSFEPAPRQARRLEKGDLIMLTTDGIAETRSPSGELYGDQKILDVVKQCLQEPSSVIVDELMRSVAEFSGGRKREDDSTCIALKLEG